MPYIPRGRRSDIAVTSDNEPENAGELNYRFTMDIKWYVENHGASYQTFNDILGALEGAKLEFYRRVVAPYEDKKIIENGDVY